MRMGYVRETLNHIIIRTLTTVQLTPHAVITAKDQLRRRSYIKLLEGFNKVHCWLMFSVCPKIPSIRADSTHYISGWRHPSFSQGLLRSLGERSWLGMKNVQHRGFFLHLTTSVCPWTSLHRNLSIVIVVHGVFCTVMRITFGSCAQGI